MPAITLTITNKTWPIRGSFTLSRGAVSEVHTLHAAFARDGHIGYGEARPYGRFDETPASVRAQIEAVTPQMLAGATRQDLLQLLPPGAARNLLDLALWDWEAKSQRQPVWQLAGLPAPQPAMTAYTISLAEPDTMAHAAREAAAYPLLKLKLGTPQDLPRLRAIRNARPDAKIIVDANEGWSIQDLKELAPEMAALGVVLCEQPLPEGQDDALAGCQFPFVLCADESAHTAADLPRLKQNYGAVNIKLDKAGGLTAAIAMVKAAKAQGFGVMLGCMVGSSLAIAPAALLAPLADWVDLDGPLLLKTDCQPALMYQDAWMQPAPPNLWG